MQNLETLKTLIEIRDYLDRTVNNFYLDKKQVSYANKLKTFLDKKILKLMCEEEFKNSIGYEEDEPTTFIKHIL